MALVIADVAEVEWLKRALYSDADAENLTHKLFKTNVTPAESDTASSFTVADFTGYVNKTLTSTQSGSTWGVPGTAAGVTSSQYGTNSTWTAGSSQTVYGHYGIFATSTVLAFAESFGGGLGLVSGSEVTIVPKLQLD